MARPRLPAHGCLHRYPHTRLRPAGCAAALRIRGKRLHPLRERQGAGALDGLKVGFGDRVATLAWNGYRHMELYFGVSGSGRVLHTLNPRLHPDQVVWIANHAEDKVLCFDASFLPIVQAVHARCKTIQHYVIMCDADKLPKDSGIPNLISYEAWIASQSQSYNWPTFDENAASSLCYTSGTNCL